MPLTAAKKVMDFVKSSMNQAGSLQLIKYERQVVNGWNHKLEFLCNGKHKTVVVYESPEYNF